MRRVARTSRTAVGLGPTQTSSRSAGGPGVADAPLGHVAAHLRVDPLRRAPERQLAQRDQIALAEELLDGAARLLGNVDLPLAQPLLQHVGGDIHQLDLVGPLEHGVGHRLAHLDAGDLGDHVVQALEMLDVEGGSRR